MRNKESMTRVLMCVFLAAMSGCIATDPDSESYNEPRIVDDVTYISLTEEEARQLEVLNGIASDEVDSEVRIGGFLAVPGVMTKEQSETLKKSLLVNSPIDDSGSQTGGKTGGKTGGNTGGTNWCSGYHITNVTYRGNNFYFSNAQLGGATGWGPQTLNVSVQKVLSATISCSASLSVSVLNAGIGYSQNSSYSVSSSSTFPVPSGKYGTVKAFALHDKHTWQVWDDDCGDPVDTYIAAGTSWRPNNVVYYQTTLQ